MKRKTVKEILAESLHELAVKKTIDKITVREIASNCDYSVPTFYRHFKDKYDLAFWDYGRRVDSIADRIGDGSFVWRDVLIAGIRYYKKNKEYFMNLINHTSGMDSFLRYITQKNTDFLEEYLTRLFAKGSLDPDWKMLIRVYSYGLVMVLYEWMENGAKDSPEYMADICVKAMPERLNPFFFSK